jgi:hypothetical protein
MEVFYQRYGDVIQVATNNMSIVSPDGDAIQEIKSPRNQTLSALSFTDLSANFDLIMKQKHHNFQFYFKTYNSM